MGEKAVHPNENLENGEPDDENMDVANDMSDDEDYDENEPEMTPEEFEEINSQMDDLNEALDTIEQKNDHIYSELLKLLEENRAIRKQMQECSAGKPAENSK